MQWCKFAKSERETETLLNKLHKKIQAQSFTKQPEFGPCWVFKVKRKYLLLLYLYYVTWALSLVNLTVLVLRFIQISLWLCPLSPLVVSMLTFSSAGGGPVLFGLRVCAVWGLFVGPWWAPQAAPQPGPGEAPQQPAGEAGGRPEQVGASVNVVNTPC